LVERCDLAILKTIIIIIIIIICILLTVSALPPPPPPRLVSKTGSLGDLYICNLQQQQRDAAI